MKCFRPGEKIDVFARGGFSGFCGSGIGGSGVGVCGAGCVGGRIVGGGGSVGGEKRSLVNLRSIRQFTPRDAEGFVGCDFGFAVAG